MGNIGQLVDPWGLREPHRVFRFPNIMLEGRFFYVEDHGFET